MGLRLHRYNPTHASAVPLIVSGEPDSVGSIPLLRLSSGSTKQILKTPNLGITVRLALRRRSLVICSTANGFVWFPVAMIYLKASKTLHQMPMMILIGSSNAIY
jgi:hypothetical protein